MAGFWSENIVSKYKISDQILSVIRENKTGKYQFSDEKRSFQLVTWKFFLFFVHDQISCFKFGISMKKYICVTNKNSDQNFQLTDEQQEISDQKLSEKKISLFILKHWKNLKNFPLNV